ncbi:hypothetical protein JCM10450v2_007209 [Rhodotorula kratochvilovae]
MQTCAQAGKSADGGARRGEPTPDNVSEVSVQLGRATLSEDGNVGDEAATTSGAELSVADELQGDTDSEQGKFKALLGILRKTISVKDLSSVRISLPANMMEPIGNLEFWTYIDRPDYFAALADLDGADELTRMLALLRWMFTKELKYAKHPIAKSFNSILGEHFRCYYDTPLLDLHPEKGHPLPAIHLDESPAPEVVISAGRGSTGTSTSAAALKSTPSVTTISKRKSGGGGTLSSSASFASVSSTAPSSSGISARTAASGSSAGSSKTARVVILNEQTSHHPPISHFLVEARVGPPGPSQRTVRLRGVDQLSAKYTGANVRIVPGTHNKGLFLELPGGEEWQITHPTAAVAGLLRASPYATICDATTVTCTREGETERSGGDGGGGGSKKRLRAIVEYREESWITRPRFAVQGIVYESFAGEADPSGAAEAGEDGDKRFARIKQVPKERVVGTLEGNWRGEIKWKKAGETTSTTLVDLLPLSLVPKSVAPLSEQDELETRRVWAPVVDALHKKEYAVASKEKQRIEQAQRDKAEERKRNGESYVPKFFAPEPEDVAEWDGRPVLTEAGRAALERDFQADYSDEV